jgi:hypothetical protein
MESAPAASCYYLPLVPTITLRILFADTLNLCSFLQAPNQVSDSYKTLLLFWNIISQWCMSVYGSASQESEFYTKKICMYTAPIKMATFMLCHQRQQYGDNASFEMETVPMISNAGQ